LRGVGPGSVLLGAGAMVSGQLSRFRLLLAGLLLACAITPPAVASASSASDGTPSRESTSKPLDNPSVRPFVPTPTTALADSNYQSLPVPQPARPPGSDATDPAALARDAAVAQALAELRERPPVVKIHRHSGDVGNRASARPDLASNQTFARSLVYSSAGALVIAGAGLIFLGTYRRFW
jgi:hypothetical protein